MSYTKDPHYPKTGPDTQAGLTPANKRVKVQALDFPRGGVADIGKAPPSRVYTRDYAKTTEPDPGASSDVDYVTAALGKNPFRI